MRKWKPPKWMLEVARKRDLSQRRRFLRRYGKTAYSALGPPTHAESKAIREDWDRDSWGIWLKFWGIKDAV